MGVGLRDKNAVFGTMSGLYEEFGPKRVIETPICEALLTGACLGAATEGMLPMLIHSRINFSFLGMDQIINHISVWKEMFQLKKDLPILIRGVAGQPGWGNGAQHLGTYEEVFKAIPNLRVIVPKTPKEARNELINWAVFYRSPTIFIDQKELYDSLEDIP